MYNSTAENQKNVFFQVFQEHWQFRKQIWKLSIADMQKTYRGAALGWAWAIIRPLVTIFVYWFAISIGLRSSKPIVNSMGVEYEFLLWLVAGIIPWFYISNLLNPGIDCIRKYSYLVTKMNFPVSTIPTFVSLSKLTVNIILQIPCLLLFLAYGHPLDIYLLQLPVYILFMFFYGTAQTLLFSLLTVMSTDFANLVKSFTTAIFWLSAIIWNPDKVDNQILRTFLRINPVTYLSNGFRNVYINKRWFFEEKTTEYFLIVTLVMLVLGIFLYRKIRKDIPDVL